MEVEDTTPPHDKKTPKFIQEVTGTFLFYAHMINSTILTALSAIASDQAYTTEKSLLKTKANCGLCGQLMRPSSCTRQVSQKHEAGQGGNSSCQQTPSSPPTMVQFITWHKLSNTSCYQPLKPNLGHCTSTANSPPKCDTPGCNGPLTATNANAN